MNVIIDESSRISDICNFPPKSWKDFFIGVSTEIDNIDTVLEDKNYLPQSSKVFTAFFLTAFNDIKVVILGQDPYDTPGYAHGLAFSCLGDIPRSLQNIYKVLEKTVEGFEIPRHGNLTAWALQGVFLINTALTVEPKKPKSHTKYWSDFSEKLIEYLAEKEKIVYMLWGKDAQFHERAINQKTNLILKTSHPSPLSASRGFMDCNHFNEANEYLKKNNIKEIDWRLK